MVGLSVVGLSVIGLSVIGLSVVGLSVVELIGLCLDYAWTMIELSLTLLDSP